MTLWILLSCDPGMPSRPLPLVRPDLSGGHSESPEDSGTPQDSDPQDSGGGARGSWIGAACEAVQDCDYEDAVCLEGEDFPGGMCSQDCELYCPDRDGEPVTFCAAELDLGSGGGCVSRCDFGLFPDSGCREGYGCVLAERANEPETEVYVCLPGREDEVGSDCMDELLKRGLGFIPTTHTVEHPSDHPELDCTIEDPVYLKSPVYGVDLQYYDGTPDASVLVSCEAALAIADTIEDVEPYGVVAMRHYGTYSCRTISDSDKLSRHAYADAIDIVGFEFADGTLWTLYDHWEHDTSNPQTQAGTWLYESAYRWHDEHFWNVILTPNYNSAHDDHFHVDLTPGKNSISFAEEWFIGPNLGH